MSVSCNYFPNHYQLDKHYVYCVYRGCLIPGVGNRRLQTTHLGSLRQFQRKQKNSQVMKQLTGVNPNTFSVYLLDRVERVNLARDLWKTLNSAFNPTSVPSIIITSKLCYVGREVRDHQIHVIK